MQDCIVRDDDKFMHTIWLQFVFLNELSFFRQKFYLVLKPNSSAVE